MMSMMIAVGKDGQLHWCGQTTLLTTAGEKVGSYFTLAALTAYLKAHSNTVFLLQELPDQRALMLRLEGSRKNYPVSDGHVYTGRVRYDVASNRIISP